uniref:SHSP domain-containing protein n=1 Tax=Opuntia streptacantha TaxID=393608 RepID=A0A7C9CQ42_OPUST
MAAVEDLTFTNLTNLLNQGDALLKAFTPFTKENMSSEDRGALSPPVDIVSTPKEYIFYVDIPGHSKSDIQVQLEDDNILVIKSSGKRKREEGEQEGCKYLKLERRSPQKIMRRFRLPEDANVAAISAKCEDGVLTVTVDKIPPAKPKTIEVAIH